jgi:hypothetical protein
MTNMLRMIIRDPRLKIVLIVLAVALAASPAKTQTPPIATANSILAWGMPGPDLASVQTYTYRYYPDASATGTILNAVTCSGTATPFQCQVAFPIFNQGNHTLKLSAANAAGEGVPSAPFAFSFVGKPGTPITITIK